MKEIAKLVAIILGIALVAYIIYGVFIKSGPADQMRIPPTVVEVANAQEASWQVQIKATGTINAYQGIMVEPEVSGRVTQIFMRSGQNIEAGKPIIEIFPDLVKANLENNQAELMLAQVDYERAKNLYAKNAVSKQELDTETATMKKAQANVDHAQASLSQYTIVAPFSGRLGLKQVDLGDRVQPGTEIVNLQALQPIRVDFDVPQTFIGDLALNQIALLSSDAYPGQTFEAKVYAFDSALNQNTRSLGVRAQLPNKDEKLLPGMFVEVSLQAGQPSTVITVPETSITYSPSGNYVYVVQNDQVIKTTIETGERRGTAVEVKKGLKVNDVVVTAGQIKLRNKAFVVVSNPNGKRLNPDEIKKAMGEVVQKQAAAAAAQQKTDKKNDKE